MEWNGKEIPFGKIGLYKKAIIKENRDKQFAEFTKMKEKVNKIDCNGKQELKNQILLFVEKEIDKQLKRISLDDESLMVMCQILPINRNGEFKDATNAIIILVRNVAQKGRSRHIIKRNGQHIPRKDLI